MKKYIYTYNLLVFKFTPFHNEIKVEKIFNFKYLTTDVQ